MARAGLWESGKCRVCGEDCSEDNEHVWWGCKEWEDIRRKWLSDDDQKWVRGSAKCLRLAGIMPKCFEPEGEMMKVREKERDEDWPPRAEDGEVDDELYDDEGYLVVASDGACPDQQGDSRLRRSAQALYYGEGHACNTAWDTDTYCQGAQRAEVRAAVRWVAWAWGLTVLWTDSMLVVRGIERILKGEQHGMKMHKDLWDRMQRGIRAKGKEAFKVKKVKGHAKLSECEGDERALEERRRNNQADEMARTMAAACIDDEGKRIREEAKARMIIVGKLQRMMIEIGIKRRWRLKDIDEGRAGSTRERGRGWQDEGVRGDDEDMMGDVGEMWGEGMHEEVDEFQDEIEAMREMGIGGMNLDGVDYEGDTEGVGQVVRVIGDKEAEDDDEEKLGQIGQEEGVRCGIEERADGERNYPGYQWNEWEGEGEGFFRGVWKKGRWT